MDFSKDDLQAFDPRDPLHRGKLWVRVVTPNRAYRHYFWPRIAMVLAIVALAGGLTAAAGIWTFAS